MKALAGYPRLRMRHFCALLVLCLLGAGCASRQAKLRQPGQDTAADDPAVFVPKEARVIATHDDLVLSVACAADGGALATGAAGHDVKLWQLSSGKLLQKVPVNSSFPWHLAFSPDGTRLASGGLGGGVTLWNRTRKVALWQKRHGDHRIDALAYSPDGRWVVSAAPVEMVTPMPGKTRQTLRLWQASDGKLVSEWEVGGMVQALSFLSNDTLAVVAGKTSDRMALLQVKVQGKFHSPKTVRSVAMVTSNSEAAIDAANQTVAMAQRKGGITVASFSNPDAPLRWLDAKGIITALALAPGGKKLAVARLLRNSDNQPPARLQVWDLSRQVADAELVLGTTVNATTFSPDSKTIAFSHWRKAYLWNWAAKK